MITSRDQITLAVTTVGPIPWDLLIGLACAMMVAIERFFISNSCPMGGQCRAWGKKYGVRSALPLSLLHPFNSSDFELYGPFVTVSLALRQLTFLDHRHLSCSSLSRYSNSSFLFPLHSALRKEQFDWLYQRGLRYLTGRKWPIQPSF